MALPPRNGTSRIECPVNAVTITPHDSNDQGIDENPIYAFMVNAEGNVAVTMLSGDEVTYYGCRPGQIYPGWITRIKATGTTATAVTGFRPGRGG